MLQGSMGFGTTMLRRRGWLALLTLLFCLAGEVVAQAAFPGRPGRLAFSAETGRVLGPNTLLWDYDPRTRTRRQLTARGRACSRDSAWEDGGLAYSPDGHQIAYLHSDNCGGSVTYELRVMRADGSRNRRVAVSPADASGSFDPFAQNVAFSPDGRRLALAQGVFDVATGRPIHRSVPGDTYERLDWAVTGRLAGVGVGRGPDDVGTRIFTAWPAGADIRFVTSVRRKGQLTSYDESPDWSPTGRSIVFQRTWWNYDRLDYSRTAIWKVSPGRPAIRLQRTPFDFRARPMFSPDGRQIAFVGYRPNAIRTIAANGNGPVRELLRASRPIRSYSALDWQPLQARRSP